MSFKKIILGFCIGLPICIAARVLQITYAIEGVTGFYKNGYETFGNLMLVVMLAVSVYVYFTGFKAYKTPEQPPKVNLALIISSAGMALVLCNEYLHQKFPPMVRPWQITVVKAVTVLCIAYFITLSLQSVFKFKLLPIFHILPCIFAMIKTVFSFISVSSVAIISDNILLVAAYCLLMVFFINYAKLYNNLDTELNFRKILATGLAASVVCNAQAIAYFGVNIFGNQAYLHTDINVMFSILCFGIFTASFVVSHFYKTA